MRKLTLVLALLIFSSPAWGKSSTLNPTADPEFCIFLHWEIKELEARAKTMMKYIKMERAKVNQSKSLTQAQKIEKRIQITERFQPDVERDLSQMSYRSTVMQNWCKNK